MSLIVSQQKPIGGYFELDLPARRELPHPGLQGFQSARAAFLALLRAGRPTKVWMPRYICNSMLAPLKTAGIEFAWYDLTDELEVSADLCIGNDDWLLYVNYFGVCGAKVDSLLKRFSPAQIILDYSQAFFSPPHKQALATIYSPRKFFGVPDGGLVYSQIPIPPPDEFDFSSFARMEHLIKRLGDSPETGYAAYQRAEQSLDDLSPRRMSGLTDRILTSIDFNAAWRKRIENFQILRAELPPPPQGELFSGMNSTDIPMCFPYRSHDAELRQRLISNRVFVATYWTDAIDRLPAGMADSLVRNMLPLPIDQRYGVADMQRIVSIILDKE